MPGQLLINVPQVEAVPLDNPIPASQEFTITTATATFDGTAAVGSFLPCLQIVGPGGIIAGTFVDWSNPIGSGDVVEVTFGTFLSKPASTSSGAGGGWDAIIVKESDQLVTNSTVPVQDNALFATLTSGVLYQFEFIVLYNSPAGAAVPDMKFTVGEDSAVRGLASLFSYFDTSDTVRTGFPFETIVPPIPIANAVGTAVDIRVLTIEGWHVSGGGTLALYWAQNTANPASTVVKAASRFSYRAITA